MKSCTRAAFFLILLNLGLHAQTSGAPALPEVKQSGPQVIDVNAAAAARPFPHFWEQMFGSGRAILSLREGYRRDLRDVKKITGFEYVRFHAIFHDETGVYDEDAQGKPVYNFSYVDQIYDGLLENGVRPFVELSFMPYKLASDKNAIHPFWYKQNVSPPKDYDRWDDLIYQFTKHLVDRYGVDELAQWYFEVWNEPNIDFWAGNPKEKTYYELYDHTARAVKRVNARLRVGGPSTAQAAWADRFIAHCAAAGVPVDFVSTHVYANDTAPDVFGTQEVIPRDQMVCRAVKKVHDQIRASAKPQLPLIWSEYNASYKNEPEVTDALYMGPWLAGTIAQCDGLVDVMSYWDFSDVFEEQGVVKQPFYGGFGLVAAGGLPKPAFNIFKILHRLGDKRLALQDNSALATKKADGSLALAVWNYSAPGSAGSPKEVTLNFQGLSSGVHRVTISRVDARHGSLLALYEKMGRPQFPTREQQKELRQAAQLPPAQTRELRDNKLKIILPPFGLAVVEVR